MNIEKLNSAPEISSIESESDGDIYNITCTGREGSENVIRKIVTAFDEPSFMHK